MKALWMAAGSLAAALSLSTGSAQARDIYCDVKGGRLPDGAERTDDWYVVNSTVRKPQLPGQTKASPICGITFNSVGGMHRPIEMIAKPKLGQAQTTYNRVTYSSAKSGEDSLTIKFHHLGRTGGIQSAIVHFRIHVVDRPL